MVFTQENARFNFYCCSFHTALSRLGCRVSSEDEECFLHASADFYRSLSASDRETFVSAFNTMAAVEPTFQKLVKALKAVWVRPNSPSEIFRLKPHIEFPVPRFCLALPSPRWNGKMSLISPWMRPDFMTCDHQRELKANDKFAFCFGWKLKVRKEACCSAPDGNVCRPFVRPVMRNLCNKLWLRHVSISGFGNEHWGKQTSPNPLKLN